MSEQESFFNRANALLDRVEALLPPAHTETRAETALAFRWRQRGYHGVLQPIRIIGRIEPDYLLCIDRQRAIVRNSRQSRAGRRQLEQPRD